MAWPRLVLSVGLAVAAASPPARAERPPVADPDTDAAQRHFERGVAHYDAGRFAEALAEFTTAQRLSPRPAFHYNIARCHDRMEAWALAADEYEAFLSEAPTASEAPVLRERILVLRSREPGKRRFSVAAPITVGGLAIASVVAAAALTATANADYDAVVPGCTPRCDPARIDPIARRAYAGYGLFAVAGVAAIVDVSLWIVYGLRRRAPGPRASIAW